MTFTLTKIHVNTEKCLTFPIYQMSHASLYFELVLGNKRCGLLAKFKKAPWLCDPMYVKCSWSSNYVTAAFDGLLFVGSYILYFKINFFIP